MLTALLDITATPTGAAGTVAVAQVDRTILLRPAAGGTGWPVGWTLDADSGVASATLDLLPSNCNPHIVAEDKRGTYFPLAVTTGDGSQGLVYVGVTTDVRREIYEYIAASCGW